ncbi:MAG: hypothetical protein DI533_05385 [Cereibacter sphaeroides]|uniref:YjiS-like domain-containing protein n=1 Tax=Cereibacter sphaeroides TaxID=1063 RepID=A0A2W5SDU3_CERSP|nr:MAG: hypothetical protein DI533_05385 [Cereibacter sphaeroides]
MFASRHTAEFSIAGITRSDATHALVTRLRLALFAYRQRQQLAQLDDRALCDIGLTRQEAEAEYNRHAWDVPTTWLR